MTAFANTNHDARQTQLTEYDCLRQIAGHLLRHERPDHTLSATALVNEAFVRIWNGNRVDVKDRNHLLALASQVMREVLVDHARRVNAAKRRSDGARIPLTDSIIATEGQSLDVLEIHESLERLQYADPELARLVELRYFGGLSAEETANALGVSTKTVQRGWRLARMWLKHDMTRGLAS